MIDFKLLRFVYDRCDMIINNNLISFLSRVFLAVDKLLFYEIRKRSAFFFLFVKFELFQKHVCFHNDLDRTYKISIKLVNHRDDDSGDSKTSYRRRSGLGSG